jgi:hypothetical protein
MTIASRGHNIIDERGNVIARFSTRTRQFTR